MGRHTAPTRPSKGSVRHSGVPSARLRPLDLSALRTYPIRQRRSLVDARDFGRLSAGAPAAAFINSLPDIYAGRDLRTLIHELVRAKRRTKEGKSVV